MPRRRATAVMGSVLALLLSALVGVGTSAAAAEERYSVPLGGAWEVEGRGWGHGYGMSQWGAQGAASRSGLDYRQILDFYYPRTTMNTVSDRVLRVVLAAYAPTDTVTIGSPKGQTFTITPAGGRPMIKGGGRYTVTRDADGYTIQRRDRINGAVRETMTINASEVEFATGDGVLVFPEQDATDGTWYRGTVRLAGGSTPGAFDVVNDVTLERYLRGVVPRESPSGWHLEALKAQAVAARSYALSVLSPGATFDICDTTQCQVYGGRAAVVSDGVDFHVAGKEAASTDRAIRETAGQVRWYDGAVAFTQFHSTNGGYSAEGSEPYLVARPDPYTGTATGDTRTSWTGTLQVSAVARYCPDDGDLKTLVVTGRDGNGPFGGRITGIRLECTTGNPSLSPENNSLRFGLFSNWWRPTGGTDPASAFYLNDSWGAQANHEFALGRSGDVGLAGDWDGDGTDTVAVRRDSTYHFTAAHDGRTTRTITYGRAGDQVLVGDWDGDGVDTLAVRRGSVYYISNSISSGAADVVVPYGRASDEVLVGDWDGDGSDTLAVRRAATYYVKNSMAGGAADRVVVYGRPDDDVIVGDWDGEGRDSFAVRRANVYYIKNAIAAGAADRVVPYGRAGDAVLVGDWDADGTDTLGVHRTF